MEKLFCTTCSSLPRKKLLWVVFFLASLCSFQTLSSAIILESSRPEVTLLVTDRALERSNTPTTSLKIPLCTLAISAKHQGEGRLLISHTSLSNGVEIVPYELFCDTLGKDLPDSLSYVCRSDMYLTIPLTKICAQLNKSLGKERDSYSSYVSFNLVLEK